MVLDKKGQMAILAIMVGIIVFIMALAFSEPLIEQIDITSNATNLNCSSPTTTSVTRATCIITDMGLFYFLGSVIAVGIAFITGKKNLNGIMTSIFVFIVITVLITPLKSLIILFRDVDHLDCTNAAISVGAKLSCIVVDLWLFYFVVVAIAAGISFVVLKKVIK